MPARFFRFPRGPSIHLAAHMQKQEEKKRRKKVGENAVVYALRQVAGVAHRIEIYPVNDDGIL